MVPSGPGGRKAQTGSPLKAPEFMPWGVGRPPTWTWAASPGLLPGAPRPRPWASSPGVGGRLRPLFWRLPLGAGLGGPVGPGGPGGPGRLCADWQCWRYCFLPPRVIPHPRQVELNLSWTSFRGGLAKSRSVPCSRTRSPLGARSRSSSSSILFCSYSTSSGPCGISGHGGSAGF